MTKVRETFADIINRSGIDIPREYGRLYYLFFGGNESLRYVANMFFDECSFRDTYLSLRDFEEEKGFLFPASITNDQLDILLLFCEYTVNITAHIMPEVFRTRIDDYHGRVLLVMKKLCYNEIQNEAGIIIYVPDSIPAQEVAAIVNPRLSYRTLQYNHHSMKGNLSDKLSTLKMMADDIEPQRAKLKSKNSSLESSLFQMFNKFVRHNNAENPVIATMKPAEIESYYDDIYQMWLLAKLILDNEDRNNRVRELLGRINA